MLTPPTDNTPNPPDYLAAYGTHQLSPATPSVTPSTVMWLASCTKLITTIAALQCIERSLFTLDSPTDVTRLLPEWQDPRILTGFTDSGEPILRPATQNITLRHLLTHTSGMAYDFMHPLLMQWRASRGEKPLAITTPILTGFMTPLVAEPGATWQYSSSIDFAGLMVARANNCTLESYFQNNIFSVLDMQSTSFHPKRHESMMKRLMPMTTRISPSELVEGEPDATLPVPVDPTDEFGGGGLFSTAEDFLKVLKCVMNDDGRLLTSSSIDLMFTPALSPSQTSALHIPLSIPPIASIMAPGEAAGTGKWQHSVAGLMGLHDSDDGFTPGWIQWGGAPNLKWWIDRKGGTCGFLGTQLNPAGDEGVGALGKLFQKAIVERVGAE
jgi:CubicO group peptidase (beta-lactamase class C family)